jgi:predicted NAD/FAD-binding protein
MTGSADHHERPTVAVIGSGVSGLTAAHLLQRTHRVTLIEADDRPGGHAHTHTVADPDGRTHAIDTGFIVHNDRTYPLLRRLFTELGIERHPTEMSMSIVDESTGLEYAGGRGAAGVFAQTGRVVDVRFWRLLAQVKRFHVVAARFIETSGDDDLTTYGEFLRSGGFSEAFIRYYAVPVVSCVWSMGAAAALEYPARYLFRFLSNHGMLAVTGSPQWYTVVGGSRTYVEAVTARLEDVRLSTPVRSIERHSDGVSIRTTADVVSEFDRVVVATHPMQALAMLAEATEAERRILGTFRYSPSETVFHTDSRLLPSARRARASWNYITPAPDSGRDAPVVTYWMNRLHGIESTTDFLVTLNARDRIDPSCIIDVMPYEHPIYDLPTVEAQRALPSLASERTVFAGAYHGWGFHEDGCRSGVEAAAHFGAHW